MVENPFEVVGKWNSVTVWKIDLNLCALLRGRKGKPNLLSIVAQRNNTKSKHRQLEAQYQARKTLCGNRQVAS
jgi:hypothetical protein